MYSYLMTYHKPIGTHAVIIGGGIAGPVTAMALQKAGIPATVYEAYDRTSDGVGAFLTLAVNGLDALKTLGARPERTRSGVRHTALLLLYRDWSAAR
jgi:FAD-dependent urate hydroxylase